MQHHCYYPTIPATYNFEGEDNKNEGFSEGVSASSNLPQYQPFYTAECMHNHSYDMEYSDDPSHFDPRYYYQNMEREDWSQNYSEFAHSYNVNDDSQGNNVMEHNNNVGNYPSSNISHQNIYNYHNDPENLQDSFHHFIYPLA